MTVLSFEPTLSLTNLLAARADVRLSCRALTEGKSRGWSAYLCVVPAIHMLRFVWGTINVDEESRAVSRHVSRRCLLGVFACFVERGDRSTLPLAMLAREGCAPGIVSRLLL